MDLISLIVGVAVLGFVLWLITTYVPMPSLFKQALTVLIVIVVVVWVVRIMFGPITIAPVR